MSPHPGPQFWWRGEGASGLKSRVAVFAPETGGGQARRPEAGEPGGGSHAAKSESSGMNARSTAA
jgi:hypothetical protein